ncbi:glycosyltransferase [Vallicoccus soli]|uniref:glycosyltransferase n=1 Tax=Vallicoccus soli TaxID=2339232 RepID=UPI001C49C819|nr:glycosyltransferase [Vallicoccus soli]
MAVVTGRYARRLDGVADYVGRLAEVLPGAGVEPVVVSARGADAPCVEACRSWGPRGVLDAARAVADLRPDLVHVQFAPSAYGFSPAVGLLPAALRGLVRAPLVTTLHEYGWWSWPPRVPDGAWAPLERRRLWDRETLLLGPRSAALVATNAEHAGHVRDRLGREPVVVPIGANVPDLGATRDEARAHAREAYGVPESSPLLLFFGFVHPVKGVRQLIDALEDLRRDADVRLVVAGGFTSLALPETEARAFRAELEQRARDRGVAGAVRFTGHVAAAEVSTLLHAADAVVLPMTAGVTTKSGALLAALEHGAPVVATAAERPDPDLVDGRTVVVVPERRDADGIARGVRRVLGDPALRERVARGGRELALARSWPVAAQRHAALYREVLG